MLTRARIPTKEPRRLKLVTNLSCAWRVPTTVIVELVGLVSVSCLVTRWAGHDEWIQALAVLRIASDYRAPEPPCLVSPTRLRKAEG